MWQLPAGTGKSRVIATAALVWAKNVKEGKVHIVTPSELLKKRDEATFAELWGFGQIEGRVVYHSNAAFEAAEEDLIILDEADSVVFNQHEDVQRLS